MSIHVVTSSTQLWRVRNCLISHKLLARSSETHWIVVYMYTYMYMYMYMYRMLPNKRNWSTNWKHSIRIKATRVFIYRKLPTILHFVSNISNIQTCTQLHATYMHTDVCTQCYSHVMYIYFYVCKYAHVIHIICMHAFTVTVTVTVTVMVTGYLF